MTVTNIDKALNLLEWYTELKRTTVPVFFVLYQNTSRYLILKGGGGSGKSIFAGRKILERATSERGHRILVVRKVGKTLKQSCWKQLLGQLSRNYPYLRIGRDYTVNKTDMTIRFTATESEIIFSGIDDPEKLKSIYGITCIWIEEASELLEADFDQLDIRMRDETPYYKQIIVTFNPISVIHWLKKRFFDRRDPRATVSDTTYKDNPFLPQEAIDTLEGFKDTNPYYYTVYCLGQWGVTGDTVFDGQALSARLTKLFPPVKRGVFTYELDIAERISTFKWEPDGCGYISIFKDVEPGHPYVLGGDTAGDGSDACAGQVIDNSTGEQVAVLWRQKLDEDEYARQMYCLGMYYNTALVGIETNFSTYPVRELERLRYPKQYVRETVDNYTHKTVQAYGFRTDQKTRPLLIAKLIKHVREYPSDINHEGTIHEMLTFVRNAKWRPEAEEGAHDDLVMSLGIAHAIRDSQSYLAEASAARIEWSESMYEDYKNASPKVKEYLRSKWGAPPPRRRKR